MATDDDQRPGRRRSPNIAQVAALAGVSTATVSRALTMPGRVNAATRERVLEVIRQSGYTPNVAARSLRAARSMMVLVAVPNFITPFFSQLLIGMDEALMQHGYGMLIGNLHAGADREAQLVDLVLAGQADGVVLLNGLMLKGTGHRLAAADIPMVAISTPPEDPCAASVLVAEREGAAMALEHLLSLGHRRLGYLAGPVGNYVDGERWVGFRDAAARAGIPERAIARYQGNYHLPSGVPAAEQFLASPDRPSAIFAASDMMAIGFMRTVQAAGLQVPRDVSVVGFDGVEFADYCQPMLTTLRQPREEMGRAAAELLVRLIRGEELGAEARRIRLPVTLRISGSTGPAPAASRRRPEQALAD